MQSINPQGDITIRCWRAVSRLRRVGQRRAYQMIAIAVAMGCLIGAGNAFANDDDDCDQPFCSATARFLLQACENSVKADTFAAEAKCINISHPKEREVCNNETSEASEEENKLCREQHEGRLNVCDVLGETRYDPSFDPDDFDDPRNPTNPNPYFPLTVGNRWDYQEGAKSITVEVLDQTKLIEGVRCIVVRARDFEDGELVEDTPDWYAQAKNGDIWYCGEEVKDFELFEGDEPQLPELVSTDGAFKVGRDGDKSGIQFRKTPTAGEVYRQEFSLANAEDLNEVLSTTYEFGRDPEFDQFVPQPLAQLFCSGDCVITSDFSALEPGVLARKYYAPTVGLFLEAKPDTGEVFPLTDCNFDPRCASLPTP